MFSQEFLREVAEAVRGAFPRPSDVCELVLIDVDPRHVHAFWNIPPASAASLRAALELTDDTTPLVLRMTELMPHGETGGAFDIEVLGLQGQFYVDIWGEARCYRGAIGLRLRDGALAPLAHSNIVNLPPAGPSQDNTWREIALPAPSVAPPLRPAAPLPPAPRVATAAALAKTATSSRPVPQSAAPAVERAAAGLGFPPIEAVATGATAGAAPPMPLAATAALGAAPVSGTTIGGPGLVPLPTTPSPKAAAETPTTEGKPPSDEHRLGERPISVPMTGQTAVGDAAASVSPLAPMPSLAPPPLPPSAVISHPPNPTEQRPIEPPAPAAEVEPIVAAIAMHEREAVTPLAPFPFYEPDTQTAGGEPATAPPAGEQAPPPSAGEAEPVAAAEAAAANAEGPEPVPLPLENVLTLSSFAVAGGPVEFEINAELHIFGRTKTGLQLQLFGRPVAIRPDGSFSINRPLPNGALVLSVLLAKNGEREE